MDAYTTFWNLAATRAYGWETHPISFTEIKAYLDLSSVYSLLARERIARTVRQLDAEYLKIMNEKKPGEATKTGTKNDGNSPPRRGPQLDPGKTRPRINPGKL